jgi:hypothetical protein
MLPLQKALEKQASSNKTATIADPNDRAERARRRAEYRPPVPAGRAGIGHGRQQQAQQRAVAANPQQRNNNPDNNMAQPLDQAAIKALIANAVAAASQALQGQINQQQNDLQQQAQALQQSQFDLANAQQDLTNAQKQIAALQQAAQAQHQVQPPPQQPPVQVVPPQPVVDFAYTPATAGDPTEHSNNRNWI